MAKRTVDLFGAGISLLVLSPIMLVICICIICKMGFPIFFLQTRPGRGGVPFQMIKFRTMREAIDTVGLPLPDSQRLTSLGQLMRSTSLDELPELWNVLKGEMSLVGPRPLLMEYLPLYSHEQARRHDVRPGITGWAQINGRNAISWEEKFQLDVWYVDNRNSWLDLKIIFLTIWRVVSREGISAAGEATMPKFEGPES